MSETDANARAMAILAGIKKAGINLIASLPDINCLDLIGALERDPEIEHVPLCREEEGVGICAGARLVGRKPALIMQNAGLLNSCNGIVTTGIQLELPMLLIVYYAGDIGDRGFARVGTATIPVLEALGIRHYLLRNAEEIEWTFKNAWILAEDSNRPVAVLLTKDVLGKR
jgi:sulfopyruvate decarboxylase subunit alpha